MTPTRAVIVYVVECGEYEDTRIDSVWSTRAWAEARASAYEREFGPAAEMQFDAVPTTRTRVTEFMVDVP